MRVLLNFVQTCPLFPRAESFDQFGYLLQLQVGQYYSIESTLRNGVSKMYVHIILGVTLTAFEFQSTTIKLHVDTLYCGHMAI